MISENKKAYIWSCDGSPNFSINEADRDDWNPSVFDRDDLKDISVHSTGQSQSYEDDS